MTLWRKPTRPWGREWGRAEREFTRAIQLNPRDVAAHYFYGLLVLAPAGRLDEAIVELKKSLEADPLAVIVNTKPWAAVLLAAAV